jgi:hypothetical protein
MDAHSQLERPTGRPLVLKILVLAGLAAGAVAWALANPPLPQNPAYHHFADQRTLLGVPHFFNVISNLPFLVVGVLGLRFVWSREAMRPGGPFRQRAERWPYLLFFLGVGLTAFGSSYYHLAPTNDRLLWDRLPMSVAFMALFAAVLGERLSMKLGLWLLPVLVAAGLASVLYWHVTEQRGRGDLRFYYLVQFYPMLAMPLLLLFFPPRYTRTLDLVVALGWYVLAKVCEHPLDAPIYGLGHWVSGHTLKHLAAAAAAYWLLRMIQDRVPVPGSLSKWRQQLDNQKIGD